MTTLELTQVTERTFLKYERKLDGIVQRIVVGKFLKGSLFGGDHDSDWSIDLIQEDGEVVRSVCLKNVTEITEIEYNNTNLLSGVC